MLAGWPLCVGAQTPESLAQAAATITAAELARHVAVLTADSLQGRPTPSPALEQTARYIAAEFERLGLHPGLLSEDPHGGDSTWFQRYPLPGQQRFDYARSAVLFRPHKPLQEYMEAGFATAVRFLPEVGPSLIVESVLNDGTDLGSLDRIRTGSDLVVLVSGRHSAAALNQLDVAGKVVLYVGPTGVDSAEQVRGIATLYAKSAGVIVVSDADSVPFAAAARAASQVSRPVVDGYLRGATGPQRWPWAVTVWAGGIRAFLARYGVDITALRADATPRMQALPDFGVWLSPKIDTVVAASAATVPNVLGLLEGTDSVLKHQYVVITAHMDGAGGAGATAGPDGGADDNAVGVAGLLALARALSLPAARPQRSVLFVATSGAGPGQPFWGSNVVAGYDGRFGFLAHGRSFIVALTLDRLGRLRGDSVLISGLPDLKADVHADWLAIAHPELGVRVVDAGPAAVPDGEQYAFVRHNVPSLYVHGAGHGAAERPDGPAMLDLEAAARVVRLVLYVSAEFAAAKRAPGWSIEGRDRFLALQP